MSFKPSSQSFIGWLALECVSYLGIGFNILFYLPSAAATQANMRFLGTLNGVQNGAVGAAVGAESTLYVTSSYSSEDPLSYDGSIRRSAYNTPAVALPMSIGKNIKIVKAGGVEVPTGNITAFGVGDDANFTPLPGVYALSVANRVTINQDNNANKTSEGNYNNGEITFPQHSRIAVVNFRSISTTAGMKMLIRLGNEITLSSGTIYSMFKHRSPTYDEQAIKSYLRCIHEMKDAFYGDAASDEGHDKYAEMIRTLVWQTPTEDFTTTQGTAFSGQISV